MTSVWSTLSSVDHVEENPAAFLSSILHHVCTKLAESDRDPVFSTIDDVRVGVVSIVKVLHQAAGPCLSAAQVASELALQLSPVLRPVEQFLVAQYIRTCM